MEALTLNQLFGNSAIQTGNELIIKKSDLVAVGLTPLPNNHAEQLIIAILLQALSNFEGELVDEHGDIIVISNDIAVSYANHQSYELIDVFRAEDYVKERNSQVYLTNTIVIESYVEETD